MYRLAALISALVSLFLPFSVPAFELEGFKKLGLEVDSLTTLGISQTWTIEETKQHFTEAGIEEVDDVLKRVFMWRLIADEGPTIGALLAEDNFAFGQLFRIQAFSNLEQECLFYKNAITKREDLEGVAVCFAHATRVWYDPQEEKYLRGDGEKYHAMVVPFFNKEKTDLSTLKYYLREIYGEPYKGTDNVWLERPWYYAKLMTKNYILVVEPKRFTTTYFKDVSAMVFYVNMNGLAQVYTEVAETYEKVQEINEEQLKASRKGL